MSLCDRCRGACCEEIELPVPGAFDDFFAREWIQARGGEVIHNAAACTVRLDQRCPHLTETGQCDIHWNGEQPVACRLAAAGEPWCLEVIRRRRPQLWEDLEHEMRVRQEVGR